MHRTRHMRVHNRSVSETKPVTLSSSLVASFLAGTLREEAFLVPAQAPSPAMCSKPYERSAKLSKAQARTAQATMHKVSHNSQLSCTATNISGRWPNKEHQMLQASCSFEQRCIVQLILRQNHSPNDLANIRQQCRASTDPDQPSTRHTVDFSNTQQILCLPSPRPCTSHTHIMFMQAFATVADVVAQTASKNQTRPAAAAPRLSPASKTSTSVYTL